MSELQAAIVTPRPTAREPAMSIRDGSWPAPRLSMSGWRVEGKASASGGAHRGRIGAVASPARQSFNLLRRLWAGDNPSDIRIFIGPTVGAIRALPFPHLAPRSLLLLALLACEFLLAFFKRVYARLH